jgi:MoaA/NifB/PqqE/SkfB family radical SAM enzyme
MDTVKTLAQYINNAKEFRLLATGEPFIAPVFWELLDAISASHVQAPYILTHSNGMVLDKTLQERILNSSLSMISFSLDAATPETYKKIRNGNFDKTIDNIRSLIAMRNALGRKKPEIRLNMAMMRENVEEAPLLVRMASSIGADAVDLWPLSEALGRDARDWVVTRNGWTFSYAEQLLTRCEEKANAALAEANQAAAELGMTLHGPSGIMPGQEADPAIVTSPPLLEQHPYPEAHNPTQPGVFARADAPVEQLPRSEVIGQCKIPWEWFIVDIKGDVRICCFMAEVVGNIRHEPLDAIWNGKVYRSMRRAIRQNRIPAVCADAFCPYVRGARYVA